MIGPAVAQRARVTLAAARQTAQSRMREAGPMEKVRFVGLDVHNVVEHEEPVKTE
jgi:hypothetical protein